MFPCEDGRLLTDGERREDQGSPQDQAQRKHIAGESVLTATNVQLHTAVSPTRSTEQTILTPDLF
jgi:hypothetical protein